MASFASSLRNLLGCGQPPTSLSSSSIARFDGMNEIPQQAHRATSLETANNNLSTTKNASTTPMIGQPELLRQDYGDQPTSSHGFVQPGQHFAFQQGGQHFDHTHDTAQLPQELGYDGYSQYDESRRQAPSRTATAQPSENSQYHIRINDQPYVLQLPDAILDAGAEVRVKQESAEHDHDDQDLFAEFTNGGFDDDDDQASAETQEGSKSANNTASDPPSIKQEPASESRPLAEAVEQAERVELIPTLDMMQQTQEVPTNLESQVTHKNVATTTRVDSESAHLQSQVASTRATPVDSAQQQFSFEQYAQVPQQSIHDSQLQHSIGNTLRSPSVNSVIRARRLSSETASSHGSMDLAANSQFAMQWQGRQNLLGNGGLTADAVHMNPVLLHGPSARPATAMHQPHSLSNYPLRPVDGMQHSSGSPYNSNPMHTIHPAATQYGQSQLLWTTPDWHFSSANTQELPRSHPSTHGTGLRDLDTLHRVTEVQDEEASDDDEPLVTRVPRHRSATVSPMPASAHLPSGSRLESEIHTAAPGPSVSNFKQDSVIELSDDDEEDTATAISWKLPAFEVTYHPPATDKDLPMAKISILGATENLVRREVSLTEDHAHHEMELFLNVFLPAQQALQTPDPAPAHAVINFHTISVMVLEVFVQYEIGDEMGRGYGFHGGNISNQVLRPSPTSSDDEPTRTRSAKDADVDEIFFAVIDRWRAGLISGKGTSELIRGCQEFCDIALDVIHYVKEHGLTQPEPRKRKERSDKGVKRGPQGGTKEVAAKGKATGKRKADAVEGKVPGKKAKVNELTGRKKAKVEVKKTKPKPKVKPGVTVIKK
jgi:hypothetical protein